MCDHDELLDTRSVRSVAVIRIQCRGQVISDCQRDVLAAPFGRKKQRGTANLSKDMAMKGSGIC